MIKDINDNGIDLFITSEYGLCRITMPNKTPTVAFLSTVIVDDKHRHKGIGNKLLDTAKLIAKEYHCEVLSLQCDGWRTDWYKRKGFTIIGEGYDPNMIIMSYNLSTTNKPKEDCL
jgi:predicted GNAT family N-acyltransferase